MLSSKGTVVLFNETAVAVKEGSNGDWRYETFDESEGEVKLYLHVQPVSIIPTYPNAVSLRRCRTQ